MNNESTVPTPIGTCPNCGGAIFENLRHYCPTSAKLFESLHIINYLINKND